ncbi:LuxR C-terminal-related transcriptional regulator [Vibrio sp. NTOU-M3]|uniref:helix-turn-helix transcriptional regulator n=1 Tax=Vibrio sp. NTOU-M3 TaxID=3234954 RepID=UPI00349F947D
MAPTTLVILSDNNLQSNLIEQQLLCLSDVTTTAVHPDKFNHLCSRLTMDLVILDFHYLTYLEDLDILPDFDLLNLDILVYNIPELGLNHPFVRWRTLRGMILQTACAQHLIDGVKCILQGGMWIPRRYLEELIMLYRDPSNIRDCSFDQLTERERQVLDLVVQGSTNKEIAKLLYLSENTVKTHIYKVYRKLNVHCRSEASKLVKQARGNSSSSN